MVIILHIDNLPLKSQRSSRQFRVRVKIIIPTFRAAFYAEHLAEDVGIYVQARSAVLMIIDEYGRENGTPKVYQSI